MYLDPQGDRLNEEVTAIENYTVQLQQRSPNGGPQINFIWPSWPTENEKK